jgi:hypothetical protein
MPPFAFGVTHGFIPAFLANFLFLRRFVWIPFISCINTVGTKVMTSNFKLFLFVIILIFSSLFASAAFAAPSNESADQRTACGGGWMGSSTWVKRGSSRDGLATIESWECGFDTADGFSLQKQGRVVVCDMTAKLVENSSCVCDGPSGAFYNAGSCACPSGKEMNLWTKSCETPCPSGQERTDPVGACGSSAPVCNSPKVLDAPSNSCKCPSGTFASGEECISMPDCTSKQTECASSCANQDKAVSRFYCEASSSADPSTQLFSGSTYKCECASTLGCPVGQVEVISTSGLKSCRASSGSGCPAGSYYGDYQGKTGCIEPSSSSDPNAPPENCISGSSPVYHGSTLYCVPPPNSDKNASGNDAGCPAGTSPVLSSGTYLCKGPDGTGRTQGSGGGSGSNAGSGIGSSDAAIAATGAVEQQLKENAKADEKANAENNKELKDINSKLFAANQTLQEIKDKIPSEIKSEEESPINSAETLKTALDAAIDRLADAPIIAAASDVLGQFPDSQGSCPVIAFSFWGRDISSDLHCQLFEDVKPNLEAVMLAFWSIFAVFVFRRMG